MSLKCYICGKEITGSYYTDCANHSICAHHITSVKQCVSCGLFCNSTAIHIGLGGYLCSYCQKNMMTKEDCSYVVNFINQIYSNSVIGEIHNWSLKVIDATALQKRTGDANIRGLAVRRGNDYTVYVYRQLSKVQFAEVLAHELLHIWQYNQNLDPIQQLCLLFLLLLPYC